MSWDELDKKPGEGSGEKVEFTSLPEGITRLRALNGAPKVRWTHWMNQFQRSVNCPGKGCPICNIIKNQKANKETPTYNAQRKFAINVYNFETKKQEIMDQGVTLFNDLRDVKDDDAGGDITSINIKIKRRGKTKDDTSYRVDKYADDDVVLPEGLAPIDLDEYFTPTPVEKLIALLDGGTWDDVMKNNDEEKPVDEQPDSKSEEKDEEYSVS